MQGMLISAGCLILAAFDAQLDGALSSQAALRGDSRAGETRIIPLADGPIGPVRRTLDAIDLQFGWPRELEDDLPLSGRSATAFDFDLSGDRELAVLTSGGALFVFQHDGANYPGFPLPPHRGNRPREWVNARHRAISAVGDIDGNRYLDIVYITDIGYVHVVGENLGAEPEPFPVDIGRDRGAGVPALWDLNGDGSLEIIFNTYPTHRDSLGASAHLHVLTSRGSELEAFPVSYRNGSNSSPSVGDLDGDDLYEVVVGSGRHLDEPGRIWAWLSDGRLVEGFPTGNFETISSHIAMVDIDSDADHEILFWAAEMGGRNSGVYCLDGDGSVRDGFPLECGIGHPEGGVASADLNGDGAPDIVFGAYSDNGGGVVYAWDSGGEPLDGFPIETAGPVVGSVIIADVSGDALVDIIAAIAPREGGAGLIYAWNNAGEVVNGFPLSTEDWGGGAIAGPPAALDLDIDGDVELIAVTAQRRMLVWDTPGMHVWDSWFAEKGSMTRTGMRPMDDPTEAPRIEKPLLPGRINVTLYPNPFNLTAVLRVHMPNRALNSWVELFDLTGRRADVVYAGELPIGNSEFGIDAKRLNLAAGLYLIRLQLGDVSLTERILYMP